MSKVSYLLSGTVSVRRKMTKCQFHDWLSWKNKLLSHQTRVGVGFLFTFWSIAFILFLTIQGHPMVFLGKLDRYRICPCTLFFFSILFQHQTCVLLNWRTAIVLWHECHSVCFSSFLSLLSRLYAVVYLGRKLSIWKEVWKTVFHR